MHSKSSTINFYYKEQERKNNKSKYNISEENILSLKDTLRFEIQCDKSKTDYLKRKYKFETKQVHQYLTLEESKKQIFYYYKKCIRTGTYYNLAEAKKIINSNKDLTTRTKNNLKGVLI